MVKSHGSHGDKLLKNRKASIQDLFMVGVIIVFFGIVLLIGYKITDEFNTQFQSSSIVEGHGKNASTELLSFYPGILDNMFLFLTAGLAIVVLVLAAMVRVHPIFIAIYFVTWIILMFFSGILSNLYQEMAAETELAALANQLTFTSHIINYLPFIVGVLGMVLMLVMYKLWQNEQ